MKYELDYINANGIRSLYSTYEGVELSLLLPDIEKLSRKYRIYLFLVN